MSDFQPQRWKPRAKAIVAISQLPVDRDLTVTVKCDGEFSVISYQRDVRTFSINLWGTMRGDGDPWLREVKEALDKQPIREAVLLAETYAVEGDRMLKLPDLIHHLKNGDQSKIRLGVFDLQSVNGKVANQNYLWRLQEAESWLKGCRLVHVVPYLKPKSHDEIRAFWHFWVEQRGYEGLFARDDRQDLFKVKKTLSIDAVIIGYSKVGRGWAKGLITSLRVAALTADGSFVEVGDVASGIDSQLSQILFQKLIAYRKAEYETWDQVEPFIVVEVEATETFQAVKPVYALKDGVLEKTGEREAHSLRHPRLIRFRGDKKPVVDDIGYERQFPNDSSWRGQKP